MKRIFNQFTYDKIRSDNMLDPTIHTFINETYSQCHEDVIIASLVRAYFKRTSTQFSLSYVEIGANHPVATSSTYLWKNIFNINGILVEANPKLISELEKHRPNDVIINAAVIDSDEPFISFYLGHENEISSLNETFVANWKNLGVQEKITVPTIRINQILNQVNTDIVLLTIDVEGMDLTLIRDIDFSKYRPFIIQTEPSDYFFPGTSSQMIDFLGSKNYKLVSETDVNLIFIDNTK